MTFEKKYVGSADGEWQWQPISTDQLHQDLDGYYKDPVTAGIELIGATPKAVIRTPFAIYRFVDDEVTDENGHGFHTPRGDWPDRERID